MATKSVLARRLEPYKLHKTEALEKALGVDKAQASRWLNGARFSVETAKRIAEIIGEAWPVVFSWQENGRDR